MSPNENNSDLTKVYYLREQFENDRIPKSENVTKLCEKISFRKVFFVDDKNRLAPKKLMKKVLDIFYDRRSFLDAPKKFYFILFYFIFIYAFIGSI
jgi:hypothetical protein